MSNDVSERRWLPGFLKTCAATALYAIAHSILASRASKQAARKLIGTRARNALYRPFYLVQAAVTMFFLVRYIRKQPGKMLFESRGLAAVPFRLTQATGLCWACAAAYQVGYLEILGVRPLTDLALAVDSFPPEPEAQGPAFENNELRIKGPFRVTRHPLNIAPLPVMWCNPRMTTNLLAFNLVGTLYLVVGSLHEEQRLHAAYGEPYRRYRQGTVPFYLPRFAARLPDENR